MKKKLIYFLIFLTLGIGIFKARKPVEVAKDIKPINYTIENKIDYTKVITNKLEAIDKREIMQINLKDKFTLKSKCQNKFFKNNNIVEVFAVGVYRLNSSYVILVNGDNYVINIKLDTNIIESEISIEEDKGYLALGDLKITVEEAAEIKEKINDDLIKEMNSEENLKAVKERAETLLSEKEKYKVEVNFLR